MARTKADKKKGCNGGDGRRKKQTARKTVNFGGHKRIELATSRKTVGLKGLAKALLPSSVQRSSPASRTEQSLAQRPDQVEAVARKRRRAKPGVAALREVRKFQKSVDLLVPKAPFQRLVRELVQKTSSESVYRMTPMAVVALQEAAEAFAVGIMEDGQRCAIHAKRVTLMPQDLRLTLRLRDGPNIKDMLHRL